MAFGFHGWNSADDDLEERFRRLSKEVQALSRAVGRRGSRAMDEGRDGAAELVSELSDRLSDMMPEIRRRSRAVEQTAREHPAAVAVAGVLVVGLALSIILHRK